MKRYLLILLAIVSCHTMTSATHIVGGDIFVQWVSQNNYQFTVRVYRDCHTGSSPMPNSVTLGIYQMDNNQQVGSSTLINNTTINLDLPFGDECYTPTDLCVDEGIFTSGTVNLPDYGPGYYMSTQLFARNNIITNLSNPGNTGMTFYAEIPDPALGQNSSPDFGPYPLDAYLCIGNEKIFNFNVTDQDGDSLVYSLVDPLSATANGTTPGPYASAVWQPPFSLANICGGLPTMSIDPVSGDISAAPAMAGVFVFAVRAEEYRNGTKIGETRRDVQYSSLNCVFDQPPSILTNQDTINIPVLTGFCTDIIAQDADASDTIYMDVISNTFSLGAGAFIPNPTIFTPDTLIEYYYWNATTMQNDTIAIPPNQYDSTGLMFNTGTIAMRYCWNTDCEDLNIDSPPYVVELQSYSLGCSGSDTASHTFYVNVVPVTSGLQAIPNVFSPNGDGINDKFKLLGQNDPCFDFMDVQIFNRWGVLVFESDDPLFEWDGDNKNGKPMDEGTYYIIINGQYGGVEIVDQRFPVTLFRN
jgi:gliding motility-associated-like protein